jgi:competence protein ComEA
MMTWPSISKSELAAVTVLACGAVAGAVVWGLRGHAHAPRGEIRFVTQESSARPPGSPQNAQKIAVHVAGAVQKPGLYEILIGSRVNDAIRLAGGAKPNGYLDGVNLAAVVQDGEQIYVPDHPPTDGESVAPGSSGASEPQHRSSGAKKLPTGKININTASKVDLMRLPGVGEVTAGKIIAKRRELGRFSSPEQLLDVKGIGPKKLAAMKDYVTVD